MPTLSQSLAGRDLGHLRIIAELWGGELAAADLRSALQHLEALVLDQEQVDETLENLPPEARKALDDLLYNQGRMTWALFTRRYGIVREMGAARRDREQPYLHPVSPAEMLWYRALVGRGFFESPQHDEYAYIPDDLLAVLPLPQQQAPEPLGRPASAGEREVVYPAGDLLLDHTCTLLAAMRLGFKKPALESLATTWKIGPSPLSLDFLACLLDCAGLLDESGQPQPEPVREFLEAGRGAALSRLATGWLRGDCNDLRQTPGLVFEGEWNNDPLKARQAALDFLSSLPGESWWSLASFVSAVHARHPDFQRPAGDYDSWFIKDTKTGAYFRGVEHWDAVEGALLRYLVTGPLHWLGFLDLAAPAAGASPQAFRRSAWCEALLRNSTPDGLPTEDGKLQVRSDARLFAPRLAPRSARYLLARFCEWEGEKDGEYRYRVTPQALERARKGGLTLAHLLALLRRHAAALPPSLVKALERWDGRGVEAHLEPVVILRLASPDMLQALRRSRAGRFLGEPLSSTAVIVKTGASEKVRAILAELGYLAELLSDEPPD